MGRQKKKLRKTCEDNGVSFTSNVRKLFYHQVLFAMSLFR
jgi:hypothetical protein